MLKESEYECQKLCRYTEDCEYFTYYKATYSDSSLQKKCRLHKFKAKSGIDVYTDAVGVICGPKFCKGMILSFFIFSFNFITNVLDESIFLTKYEYSLVSPAKVYPPGAQGSRFDS